MNYMAFLFIMQVTNLFYAIKIYLRRKIVFSSVAFSSSTLGVIVLLETPVLSEELYRVTT